MSPSIVVLTVPRRLPWNIRAKVVRDEQKNLAKIRNSAAKAATGDIIVTIDADSRMSRNMLVEIDRLLKTEGHIGGGVMVLAGTLVLGNRGNGLHSVGDHALASSVGRAVLVHARGF